MPTQPRTLQQMRDQARRAAASASGDDLAAARELVVDLDEQAAAALDRASGRLAELRAANGGSMPTDPEAVAELRDLYAAADELGQKLDAARDLRVQLLEQRVSGRGRGGAGPHAWAAHTATALGELTPQAGIVSGSIDTPTLVETQIVLDPHRADRLIDLVINRKPITSNTYEYLRQVTRTNNAAVVADSAQKPTSLFDVEAVEDRCRVIAHLTEAVPLRLFDDHDQLEGWLARELAEGVLDALEVQAVNGDGLGENMTGLLNTVGIVQVAFTTDALTSARRARTVLQTAHETPTAWVLSTDDAETFDLEREGASGAFLSAGPGLENVFGRNMPIITSTSVDAGTALLADWRQARLYVREGMRVDVDVGGALFETNEAKLRGEGRFGVAFLRPSAFAVVDLAGV